MERLGEFVFRRAKIIIAVVVVLNLASLASFIRFDLDTEGNTSDVAIVEADPAGFKDEAVARHIRRSRFRPLIVDGRLTPADDLAIQFKFRYLLDAVASDNSKAGD